MVEPSINITDDRQHFFFYNQLGGILLSKNEKVSTQIAVVVIVSRSCVLLPPFSVCNKWDVMSSCDTSGRHFPPVMANHHVLFCSMNTQKNRESRYDQQVNFHLWLFPAGPLDFCLMPQPHTTTLTVLQLEDYLACFLICSQVAGKMRRKIPAH